MATAKKIVRKSLSKITYVNRPSQTTRKKPTVRLKKRRTVNKIGSGMFPNPKPRNISDYRVMLANTQRVVAVFRVKSEAIEYAKALATKTGKQVAVSK